MATIIGSPTRYIQGRGELKRLAQPTESIGKHLCTSGINHGESAICESLKCSESTVRYEVFYGECYV